MMVKELSVIDTCVKIRDMFSNLSKPFQVELVKELNNISCTYISSVPSKPMLPPKPAIVLDVDIEKNKNEEPVPPRPRGKGFAYWKNAGFSPNDDKRIFEYKNWCIKNKLQPIFSEKQILCYAGYLAGDTDA